MYNTVCICSPYANKQPFYKTKLGNLGNGEGIQGVMLWSLSVSASHMCHTIWVRGETDFSPVYTEKLQSSSRNWKKIYGQQKHNRSLPLLKCHVRLPSFIKGTKNETLSMLMKI